MKKKQPNASNKRNPIMNRLQKYSLGSQSMALLSGVLGQTAICSGEIIALDVGPLTNGSTLNAAGSGSLGADPFYFDLTQSSYPTDRFEIQGNANPLYSGGIRFVQLNGGNLAIDGQTSNLEHLKYFASGDIVDASSTFTYGTAGFRVGYITSHSSPHVTLGPWTVDRPNGAIGFRNGDGEYGYILVSWAASTKTLTFLGTGFFDDTPNSGITVGAAIPEPSDYAAALGLGALGLAYYRRRPGSKTRPKN